MQRYQNRDHRTAANECCTGSGNNCNDQPCNNLFIFCAGPSGQALVDTGTCPYGMFSFTIRDDDFSLTTDSSSIVSGSSVPNPIVFQKNDRWTVSFETASSVFDKKISHYYMFYFKQGRFQLHIVVRNNSTQPVDSFTSERGLNPSPRFTRVQRINGNLGQGEIRLLFRVQCSPNYYGSDCNTRCVQMDRSTCDSNGNIVCNAGYQNAANGCSDCVSATLCGKQQ